MAAPATSTHRRAAYDPTAASIDVGNALAVRRDGRIVLAGLSRRYGEYDFALARYRPDGRLDTSFGVRGLVLTRVGRGGGGAYAVAEAPARKVLAVGGAHVSNYRSGFALVRYTRRGQLDRGFGGDGEVVTTFARPRRDRFATGSARDVVLHRDGRISVVGSSSNVVDDSDLVLARYVARGTLDRSFGVGGKASYEEESSLAAAAVALARDGKLVVAGSAYLPASGRSSFAVVRFTTSGRVDRAFGVGGRAVIAIGSISYAQDLATQLDGRIVVAGFATVGRAGRPQLGLVRLLPDGGIDTSFGTNGTVLTNFAAAGRPSLAIQPDGKIVAACGLGSARHFGLARYLPDGSLDPTFGEGGRVRTRFSDRAVARDVALTRNGKIVVGGSVGGDFALARYNADGSLDTSFDTDGLVRTPLGPAWFRRR